MFDFHFDRAPTTEQLLDALAQAFSVPRESILMVADITGDEDVKGLSLLCTSHRSDGEFPLHVSVYPQSDSVMLPTESEAARFLCRSLEARCLITDDRENPYTWLLVDVAGKRPVSVDPDALESEVFILIRGSAI
ncbi:MAG: hypothetical protein WBV82_27725 [Myxococcaceae bacterium]